ncbi:outer membrane receptor protein involved in Fe transport [Polymorphobacter multimanifer]|uniref:Outer membrane receptor protein involved in Fe transport n=1 Tax=Polymorphobacter multimanifer TaxID=1070431 RepID=A0A841L4G5_9SPHN|nr:TonB-dependent receptor [Polymorphobacter multimanifer]MBB6227547.1 outer membrane receptor protein involved in Fe transport [Polymorphobacter multimanifer]
MMRIETTTSHRAASGLLIMLLASTALASAGRAQGAQPAPAEATTQQVAPGEAPPPADTEEQVDISAPGGGGLDEIVVIGTRIPNVIRSTREVVSVLSQADIARSGEGDIAGALKRVTGLSVVGGKYVYVRGLGERYSLALLNGLPIPSPDPLRRVVPLDLFPTSVLASSVVQKSYSANYPGEFGGGVINLTTRAVPDKPFLTFGGTVGGNTVTTGELGYTYRGGDWDAWGFDDGTRSVPGPLRAAQATGNVIGLGAFSLGELQNIARSFTNSNTSVIQRNSNIPADLGLNFQAGTSFDIGDVRIGIIASAGWENEWQTKAGKQQNALGAGVVGGEEILLINQDFDFLSTEHNIKVNGLIGLGAEFGEHKIRFTNLYVKDVIKEARQQIGVNAADFDGVLLNRTATAFFERQLIDTQAVGEFRFGNLSLDVRGTYANSKRLSPYERGFRYAFSEEFGINDFVNGLQGPGQGATIAFSRLNENVYGAAVDLGYKFETLPVPVRIVAGYAYNDNQRESDFFQYRFQPSDALPIGVIQQRPDFLLSDFNIQTYGIFLTQTNTQPGAARYEASLKVHGGYGQIEVEAADGVQLVAGVRYEKGRQRVIPVDLYNAGFVDVPATQIDRNYWLPAGTATWNFAEDMQLRLSASKTVARPQFRELANQFYFDTDNDRGSFGNPLLVDSQLTNVEGRYEWYFGRDERITLGGFYKKINKPIEIIAFITSDTITTTFGNAPRAQLYGAEVEVQKIFGLDTLSDAAFFQSRRVQLGLNYTFSKSKLQVRQGDTAIDPTFQEVAAGNLFRDGARLTGQSDHIANFQISLQDQDSLSEQTILLNYASDRVSQRGAALLPDLIERPGIRLDFVWRQAIPIAGLNFDLKFEARNLTNTRFQEFQTLNSSRIDYNTYALGRTFQLGASLNF